MNSGAPVINIPTSKLSFVYISPIVPMTIKLEDIDSTVSIESQDLGPAMMEITGPARLTGSYDQRTGRPVGLDSADVPDPSSEPQTPYYREGDIISFFGKHFLIQVVEPCHYHVVCLESSKPFRLGIDYANSVCERAA